MKSLRNLFSRIKNNNSRALKPDPGHVRFTAHRGLSGRYPENTVQAFAAASAERFSAIETDIWEVHDFYDRGYDDLGFVIMHNEDLSVMCGVNMQVSDLSKDLLGKFPIIKGNGMISGEEYRIPTLDEFIDIMKNNDKELIIEIKDEDISYEAAVKLIHMLIDEGVASRTVFGSFYKSSLITLQSITDISDGFRFQRFIGERDRGSIKSEILWCSRNDINIVSIKSSLLSNKVLKLIKENGMETEVWVINDGKEALEFIKRGVDRITTNDVLW